MTNDYQSLIHYNPVVPYSTDGKYRAYWCNYVVLSTSSIKKYQINVFGNTPDEALLHASRLQTYMMLNPMINRGGVPDDISIGIRNPVYDPISQGYACVMIMQAGMLRIMGSPAKKKKRDHIVVDHGAQVFNHGLQVTN